MTASVQRRPDWDDLRYLVAVADRGSASAAARALGVDKGTVSRRIGALEHAVGARLFDRKASGWTTTAAGRKVLAAARRMDGDVAALLVELGGLTETARVGVRLTAPQWFCSEVLLPRIAAFQGAERWIDLNLSARSRIADLAEREAEVGLRNIRPPRGEYVVRKAGELGSALYASRKWLASRPPLLSREDVLGQRMVGYPDRITYVPGFDWLDAALGGRAPLRVDDAFAIAAALRAGAGVGVIPCFLGDRDPALTRVTGEVHVESIWLVAPIELARTRAVRKVSRFVADAFAANAKALRG
jgi:DNA-binding transcriptional LysR family regulator